MQRIVPVGSLLTRSSLLPRLEWFNDALSTLKIRFFDESRTISGYTSLTHDGRDHSLCTRLQALDLIAYGTLTARRYQILGILSIYIVFILEQLGTSSIGA
jgi:hypothetical protein